MNKSKIGIWITIGVFLTILLILFLFSQTAKKYDWRETYYINDNEPFCSSVFVDIMKTYFPGKNFQIVRKDLREHFDTIQLSKKNYLFVGNEFYMNDTTLNSFMQFIYRGNTAFIACKYFTDNVAEQFFGISEKNFGADNNSDTDYNNEKYITLQNDTLSNASSNALETTIDASVSQNVTLNFIDRDLASVNGYEYTYMEKDKALSYNWKFFTQEYISGTSNIISTPLSKINSDGYNYISLDYGRGKIYILTTPILLTNFFLIQKQNLEYTSKLLSYLPNEDIIWDEYSKESHMTYTTEKQSAGPLQFILSQPSLRWSWYIMLSGLMLFIFFRGKRTQQVIPITEPNINKSLEFVQTIGRMYYIRKNQKQLADQKMKLFLHFIKEKYRMSNTVLDAEFFKTISMRSQIQEQSIRKIFNTFQTIEMNNQITDKELVNFHELISDFYKNCK